MKVCALALLGNIKRCWRFIATGMGFQELGKMQMICLETAGDRFSSLPRKSPVSRKHRHVESNFAECRWS